MSKPLEPTLEQAIVHTLRFLAVDGVERAKSGHPGMPMGMADAAWTLFDRQLRFDPTRPDWPGRDRFLLSAGHGSMLQYALLHLHGYELSLDDLRDFRQLGARTPGHPERGHTPGVETTTGPLGQGLANGVGLALAGKLLTARLATPEFDPAAFRVFVLAGDGDLMEGLSAEAASLAGHLGLGNLICLYDDNRISIEGPTELAFSEDVGKRFEAYGWHVQHVDGHDRAAVGSALETAAAEAGRPSLVCARTHIGYGSPNKQDKASSHGAPLGPEETRAAKRALGWPEEPAFHVPPEVRAHLQARLGERVALREAWERDFEAWRRRAPEKAALWDALHAGPPADGLFAELQAALGDASDATRALSGKALQLLAARLPGLVGGSADLAPSNNTELKGLGSIGPGRFEGRNVHFGVREHAMGAILNGLALSGAFIPYGGTFLVFADYLRPALRLSALMQLPCVYVLTHDSIFLGEDGPTHQPIEHLASLRVMPGVQVVRPADARETAAAWSLALARRDGPTALVLSRQKLPALERPAGFDPQALLRGGYLLVPERPGGPRAVVVATGSEVAPAAQAARALGIRCVSMPCVERFLAEPADYRARVLPPGFRVAAVEASRDFGWHRLTGPDGLVIGLDGFGASGPAEALADHFALTPEKIQARLAAWLS
jgi:transketolase